MTILFIASLIVAVNDSIDTKGFTRATVSSKDVKNANNVRDDEDDENNEHFVDVEAQPLLTEREE